MFSYTKRNIYFITLIISIIIFLPINYLFLNNFNFKSNLIYSINYKNIEIQNNGKWIIEIPQIKLKAPISHGTSNKTLKKYVGHFNETSKTSGNIGLIAHSKGHLVNYFQNIKQLEVGDKIIYQYMQFKKIYIVEKNIIIKETDWSYLSETEENKITLISGVENQPEFRRCIQGIEQ